MLGVVRRGQGRAAPSVARVSLTPARNAHNPAMVREGGRSGILNRNYLHFHPGQELHASLRVVCRVTRTVGSPREMSKAMSHSCCRSRGYRSIQRAHRLRAQDQGRLCRMSDERAVANELKRVSGKVSAFQAAGTKLNSGSCGFERRRSRNFAHNIIDTRRTVARTARFFEDSCSRCNLEKMS